MPASAGALNTRRRRASRCSLRLNTMIQKEERLVYRLVHSLLRPTKCNVFRQYLTPKIDRYPLAPAHGTVYSPPMPLSAYCMAPPYPPCICQRVPVRVCIQRLAPAVGYPHPARAPPSPRTWAGRAQVGCRGQAGRTRTVDRRGPWGGRGPGALHPYPLPFCTKIEHPLKLALTNRF